MPELRWILLVVGLVAIAGIYLWTRLRSGSRGIDAPPRREPVVGAGRAPWDPPSAGRPGKPGGPESPGPAGGATTAAAEDLIVVLRVRARSPGGFDGEELAAFFAEEGLEHGRLGAFHSLDPAGQPRFMVASLTEPGSFDPDAMAGQFFLGVSLFMVLPGPEDPPGTLDAMMSFARRMAARLGGEVLDESANALTAQEAGYIREKVVEYWRRVRIGGGVP